MKSKKEVTSESSLKVEDSPTLEGATLTQLQRYKRDKSSIPIEIAVFSSFNRAWKQVYKQFFINPVSLEFLIHTRHLQLYTGKEFLATSAIFDSIGVNMRYYPKAKKRLLGLVNGGFLKKKRLR